MKNIYLIARNTFKSMIRDKIFYGIFGFAVLFLLSIVFLGSISLGNDLKIIKDLGLAGIYIFGLILCVFFGTSLINRELDERTFHLVILRPVSKMQFVLGKFFGLITGLAVSVILMNVVYLIIVFIKGGGFDYLSLLQSFLLIFELSILSSIALFFSVFTTHLAGTLYLLAIIYTGHGMSLLKKAAEKSGSFARFWLDLIYYLFPNLEKFNIRNLIVYGLHPTWQEIALTCLYGTIFTIIFLCLSTLLLQKHEE